jgi:hypothetical protein
MKLSTWACCVLFLGSVVFGDVLVGRDGDLFTHIAYGNHVLRHGFGATDSTIFTTTAPPVLHKWLTEVAFALLDDAIGLGAPLLLAAVVWASIPVWILRLQIPRFGFWPGLLAGSMVLVGLGSSYTIRPHILSWMCFPHCSSPRARPGATMAVAAIAGHRLGKRPRRREPPASASDARLLRISAIVNAGIGPS